MNDPRLRALWQQRPDSAGTAPDPAYGAVPPAKGDCPASDTGGHYYEKRDGQWVCTLEEAS